MRSSSEAGSRHRRADAHSRCKRALARCEPDEWPPNRREPFVQSIDESSSLSAARKTSKKFSPTLLASPSIAPIISSLCCRCTQLVEQRFLMRKSESSLRHHRFRGRDAKASRPFQFPASRFARRTHRNPHSPRHPFARDQAIERFPRSAGKTPAFERHFFRHPNDMRGSFALAVDVAIVTRSSACRAARRRTMGQSIRPGRPETRASRRSSIAPPSIRFNASTQASSIVSANSAAP